MDQRRLLPGGPSRLEGSTVGPRVLSLLSRVHFIQPRPSFKQFSKFNTSSRKTMQYNMPLTHKLCDIWEHTLTQMLGYDHKVKQIKHLGYGCNSIT